jgi:alkylhydroperoxidase family enzyme
LHDSDQEAPLARLPFVEPAQVHASFPDLAMHQNFQRVYANSPGAMRAFMGVTGHVREHSGLDARLRELAVLQIGRAAGSDYVFAHHVKTGLGAGLAPGDITAIASGNLSSLGPLDRAVVSLANAMTLRADVSDDVFQAVRNALGDGQLMDLLFVIGHYIAMAALITTLRIEVEPSYQGYLTEFPVTAAN